MLHLESWIICHVFGMTMRRTIGDVPVMDKDRWAESQSDRLLAPFKPACLFSLSFNPFQYSADELTSFLVEIFVQVREVDATITEIAPDAVDLTFFLSNMILSVRDAISQTGETGLCTANFSYNCAPIHRICTGMHAEQSLPQLDACFRRHTGCVNR
jgi:hypothetical protein